MSTIMFLMLQEQGHLLPTFKLAKALERRGHRVIYLADQQQESYVRAQGHESFVITHRSWQPSTTPRVAAASRIESVNDIIFENRSEFGRLLKTVPPDLCVIDGFMPSMAVVASESGLSSVLLHTNLDVTAPSMILNGIATRNGLEVQLLEASLKVPEMVLCPKAFDFTNALNSGRTLYFVEASVDLERQETPFDWGDINPGALFIYCSLGSQGHFFSEGKRFFQTAIDAVAARPEWQMIVSVGSNLNVTEFQRVPRNVRLVNWAPQLEMLKKASMMITHGGLGTVKECIFFGVPMIVFPLSREQPLNAARVVHHGIGRCGDIRSVSVEQVTELIGGIESNPSFKEKAELMGRRFHEVEASGRGVKVIEKVLEVLARKKANRLCVGTA